MWNAYNQILLGLCKDCLLSIDTLTLVLWSQIYPAFANSVDPDQLALFVIENVNLYQQPGSSNLIRYKLEVGVAF